MTELSVSVEDGADGAVIVRLSGEADITTAPALAEALSTQAAGHPALLVVDASGVTFIDSPRSTCSSGPIAGCTPTAAVWPSSALPPRS